MSKDIELTQADIERGERQLQAEIKKCELAIEKARQELDTLKNPKGFFASPSKKAVKTAEEQLQKLEVRMIDLQAMTGEDFCRYQKSVEKTEKLGNVFSAAGDVIENAASVVPVAGRLVGKIVGKGLKSIGESFKKS